MPPRLRRWPARAPLSTAIFTRQGVFGSRSGSNSAGAEAEDAHYVCAPVPAAGRRDVAGRDIRCRSCTDDTVGPHIDRFILFPVDCSCDLVGGRISIRYACCTARLKSLGVRQGDLFRTFYRIHGIRGSFVTSSGAIDGLDIHF